MANSLTIVTHSPDETRDLGASLGRCASEGDVFLLQGELGAGKTCLTQGIATGLDVQAYTRSPSFVIATRYQGRCTLHHVDLYRLEDPMEVWDLALDEVLGRDGVGVVEWADRAQGMYQVDALVVTLQHLDGPSSRSVELTDTSGRYGQHLEAVQREFSSSAGDESGA